MTKFKRNSKIMDSKKRKELPPDSILMPHKRIAVDSAKNSASSLNVVSTVFQSSHSASSPTCNTIEVATDSNAQMQASESMDAKRLDVPCRVMAMSLDDVTSTSDCQKLENIDDVNVDKNVQSEINTTLESEDMRKDKKFVVNEVQNITDVIKHYTVNKENCETLSNDISNNEISHLVTSKPSFKEDKFKKFTNPSDTSNLSVSCLTTISETEINEVKSDKNTCLDEVKNPPIAEIITVDNLPIQSHVIEVPSIQNSSAFSSILGKSAEVSSLSTYVLSCGNRLPSKNPVVQDNNDTSVCGDRVSPLNIALLTMPCNSDKKVKLVNHGIKIVQEVPSAIKENQNLYSSKDFKFDPVAEERKRCMLLSEVLTSAPSPPSDITSVNLSSSNSDDTTLNKNMTNVQLPNRKMNYCCEACVKTFNGIIPYQAHLRSAKHEKKINTNSISKSSNPIHSKTTHIQLDEFVKENNNEYICILCKLTLNSVMQAQTHVFGKKHRREVGSKIGEINSTNIAPISLGLSSEVESSKISCIPETSQNSDNTKYRFNFQDIVVKNVMEKVKIFGVDDALNF